MDLATDEENARMLREAAEALKLLDVAFLVERARKSVLDGSERADMMVKVTEVLSRKGCRSRTR